ncbi:ABC transporter permease [Anoxybacillus rupiensis]|uniref:ABC transporter permease n=1 Tax=Anoxybacteroides rupiense TaxID=311460 RepID=A0ABT5W7A4_9BACL|nr:MULTISPECIES: ABC transporter permease [Anoxybacillus]MBS2770521.1 ABC transporter permease [Anoxybacillus rupiensis]MDE8565217.1 ABC transporter permease [Anoxybacillus rupiensis]QHC03219.1 ABC transporter permease [Anoxybacillus sp. PDR2]
MNIIRIAFKEIKSDFRDIRTLVFMLAFPIVLMLILGTALSNTFNTSTSVGEIHVLYKDQTSGEFSGYVRQFMKEAKKSALHFKRISGQLDAKKEVQQGYYDGYMTITNEQIQLYVNDTNSIKGSVIQGMAAAFADQYNIATAVAKVKPEQVQLLMNNKVQNDYIKETSLHSKRQPGAMDYYAIAMTTMIALYGALSASYLIRGERTRKTADRLLAAPVHKFEIFIGKIFGNMVVNFLCVAIVITFSKFVFKAYWGHHLALVYLVVFTEVLFAISLGLGISYIARTEGATRMILMIVIQLASFLGGAYFKIEATGPMEKLITNLSPLTWVNTALTKIIYLNDVSAGSFAMLLNVGLAALFLLIAGTAFTRQEGL